MSVKIE